MAGTDGTADDARWMHRAIALAPRGIGHVNPNPLVGAVIVRDGRLLGEGAHERFGSLHAERNALADCARRGNDPAGATAYVTLEPCSHTGHQPPCVDALIDARIARVVVGSRDPNPLVNGRGVARLRAAGIHVDEDVLREECDALNPVFLHYVTARTPYVVAKWAMSADGRIACASGDARWVTGPLARAHGHALRNRLAAVMVGAGTVAADDPLLTCRLEGGRNPLRVVCDARLATVTPSRAIVASAAAGEAPLLVACACDVDGDGQARDRAEALRAHGVQVVSLPGADGLVDLPALMAHLAAHEVDSVLLEGGARLHAAALAAGVVQEVVAYVAPKVIGGAAAPGPVAGAGATRMTEAIPLGPAHVAQLGPDVRVSWRAGATDVARELPCVSDGDLGPVWERARAALTTGAAGRTSGEREGVSTTSSQARGGE